MKNSKKLIAAVAALVVALAVSVGSTFAWFTTNQKVTVSNINAQVTTGSSNLEVALVLKNGSNWYLGDFTYNLDLQAELKKAAGKIDTDKKLGVEDYLKNLRLDALTDKGPADLTYPLGDFTTTNGANLTDKKGKSATTTVIGDNGSVTTNGSFIEIYLAFRTPGTGDISLYLSDESTIVSAGNKDAQTIKAWDNLSDGYSGTAMNVGSDLAAKAQDAMRVGFFGYTGTFDMGNLKVTENAVTAYTQKGVWAPYESTINSADNAKKSGFYGKVAGANDTAHKLSEEYEIISEAGVAPKAPNPSDYEKYKDDTHTTAEETEEYKAAVQEYNQALTTYKTGDYATAAAKYENLYKDPGYTEIKTGLNGTVVTTLSTVQGVSGYQYGFLYLRIWVEGTDGDCFNNIFGDIIDINLAFEVEEPKA